MIYYHLSINPLWFGFKSGASTEHALLKFSHDFLKLFEKKVAIATFMDPSKALDVVDHEILLSKLKRYGNHTPALQWINSYLSDRTHLVIWNQIHSRSLSLNILVPRKVEFFCPYCFTPTLMILLIPVLTWHSFFADDTTVYVHDSIEGTIQILSLEFAQK